MRLFQFAIVLIIVAVWFLKLSPAAPPERVILDTDSGPFNDDGVALVMVARSPQRVTLEAITLVPGNAWVSEGARYTARILQLLGRAQVPLLPGAQAPLVNSPAMAQAMQKQW